MEATNYEAFEKVAEAYGVDPETLDMLVQEGYKKIAAGERQLEKTAGLTDEEALFLFGQGLEKIAQEQEGYFTKEATDDFTDALTKVAHYTGFDPDYLADAIIEHRDELVKLAQIENYVDDLSDEEVERILKEAAEDPNLAPLVAEAEMEQENEQLAYLSALVDELGEDEANELLQEMVEADKKEKEE